jgi:hypothetical protein
MYRSSIHLVKVPTNPCYYLEFSPQKQKNQAARAGHGEFFDWHFANGSSHLFIQATSCSIFK